MDDKMTKGVMLTPLKYEHDDQNGCKDFTSESFSGGVMEELEVDLDLPLRQFLTNIFSHDGRVIIDFPEASYEQVIFSNI